MEAKLEKNLIQTYFKEINEIYKENEDECDIEYCPENREKLIKMNLKLVIHIAKKYLGLGFELDDLIQYGNEGLCIAWDKFDPDRNSLKQKALKFLEGKQKTIKYDEMAELFELISYGALGKKFMSVFGERPEYDREELKTWINKNVFNAKFNSVAAMWIRAKILEYINLESRLVKKPKAEIYKDKQENNSYITEIVTDLSGLETDDNYIADDNTSLDINESYVNFRKNLMLLLEGVSSRDRSIILKKFGIGLPRPMVPKEIAEQEGLSIARISQIIQNAMEKMIMNSKKYNIQGDKMYYDMENMVF